jgi:hypothetical protein
MKDVLKNKKITFSFFSWLIFIFLFDLIIFFKFNLASSVYADDSYYFLITATNPPNGANNVPINLKANAFGQGCSTQNDYEVCGLIIGIGISPNNPKTGIGYPIVDESSVNSNSIIVSSSDNNKINVRFQGKQECSNCGDFYHSFSITLINSNQEEILLKPNSTYTITIKSGENGLKAYYEASYQKYYAYLEQDYSWSFTTGDDTVPPKISLVAVKTTNKTAFLSWITNEQATNKILYGLTTDYDKNITFDALSTNHSATFSNLDQGKKYYYKIISKDAFGNENFFIGDFNTLEINNVQVSSIDNNSAVISWTTNRNTDSYVEYGTSLNYGLLEGNNIPITIHNVRLVNLSPGTVYNFRIRANENGLISYSQNYSFKTTGEQPQGNSSPSLIPNSPTPTNKLSPTMNWTTQLKAIKDVKSNNSETKNNSINLISKFPTTTKALESTSSGKVAGVSNSKNQSNKFIYLTLGATSLSVIFLLNKSYFIKIFNSIFNKIFKQ